MYLTDLINRVLIMTLPVDSNTALTSKLELNKRIMDPIMKNIMSPIMRIMGPIMRNIMSPIMRIMGPIMKNIMSPIMRIMGPIMKNIMSPIMRIMGPIMKNIMSPIMRIMGSIMRNIMSPIMRIMKTIMSPTQNTSIITFSNNSPLGAVFQNFENIFWTDEDRDIQFRVRLGGSYD